MSTKRLYLAVVPAYNESATIATVVEALRRHATEFDTLVIDDGSTDGTDALAFGAGATVLKLPFNVGIGALCKPALCMRSSMAMTSWRRWTGTDNTTRWS